MDYQNQYIPLKELNKPREKEDEKTKKVSKYKTFLANCLKNPLMIDFSKDSRSSFSVLPREYKRYRPDQKD